MKKKFSFRLLSLVMSAALIFSGVFSLNPVLADESSDARAAFERKLESARKLKEELEASKARAAELKDKYSNDIQNAQAYIEELDASLNELSEEMFATEELIRSTEKELEETRQEMERLEHERKELYELIKARVRYTYENGATSYIEIILGAKGVTDLLNRMEYISDIQAYDNSLLEDFERKAKEAAEQEKYLEASLEELKALKDKDSQSRETIEELVRIKGEEINSLMGSMGINEEEFFNYVERIDAQNTLIEEIIRDEEERLAEEERKRKEEEERRRREAEELAKKQNIERLVSEATKMKNGEIDIDAAKEKMAVDIARRRALYENVSYDPDAIYDVVLTDETDVRKMIWPLPGDHRVYCSFGYRYAPSVAGATSYHEGYDIGGSYGAPIVAALAGTVSAAGWDSSAGNYVRIDHGNGFQTSYFHASKLLVSKGDYVQQGQKIALVGSTGASTGSHLHFGLRFEGLYINPEPFLGPLD